MGGGQSVAWILAAKQPVPYRVQRLIGKGTAKGAGSQLDPAIQGYMGYDPGDHHAQVGKPWTLL